jgi:deoxyribodipyrimidine photo-lyase
METVDEKPMIVWFRRDLRVTDNPALLHAAAGRAPVLPVYAVDWEREDRWAPGRASRWWLGGSLERLSASLAGLGAPLVLVEGRPEEALASLALRIGAGAVVWNRLYEPFSRDLDRRVGAALERHGVASQTFNAGLLFEPEGHISRSGRPFAQFTAYWRDCLSLPEPEPPLGGVAAFPGLAGAAELGGATLKAGDWRPEEGSFAWEPGEKGAQKRLDEFVGCCLAAYETGRDLPGSEGTSRLSPHLHFGEIGPRQVWRAARDAFSAATTSKRRPASPAAPESAGPGPFLRQLGWREFAHYLLYHYPWTPDEPFRPEFARFPWQDDAAGLAAWEWGTTGYPLVDAAARQLLAEGWVHNRARLVSASFLTKDLLIPWQDGAAWYWDRLVDADLANNTLGWQWTAGSGPDAAPYFRVFNPVLQARRFDADGAYVRTWKSEDPGGPDPIVDHGEARARALAAFRGLRHD